MVGQITGLEGAAPTQLDANTLQSLSQQYGVDAGSLQQVGNDAQAMFQQLTADGDFSEQDHQQLEAQLTKELGQLGINGNAAEQLMAQTGWCPNCAAEDAANNNGLTLGAAGGDGAAAGGHTHSHG